MQSKIEWFQEVLSLEPGSRVFFPLAKLFVQIGERENAVATLKSGLDRHPEYLEARMCLVQLLTDMGRTEEALENVERVVAALKNYPAFWQIWAQSQPDQNRDFAVFLMLVSSWLQGRSVHWTDIVLEGVNSLSERLVGPLPEHSPPAARPLRNQSPLTSGTTTVPRRSGGGLGNLRTRTMADLLAAQGDYQGALDIYRELLGQASETDRADLSRRVRDMEAGLAEMLARPEEPRQEEDVFSQHAKNRLIGTLETLAARFEARVRKQDAG